MSSHDGTHQPRRPWRAAAAGIAVSAFAAFLAFTPAAPAMAAQAANPPAATACNAMVTDATSAHVLHDDSAVTQAAAKLEAKGADVRVRIFTTAPDGSLDAYEASQIADCPSWSFQGQIKPNLIVFLVAQDHQDAIYYGKNYSSLQDSVDQIRADMGGDFRQGHFAAGIAKGEQEAYGSLYPSGLPGWAWALIIAGGIIVILAIAASAGSGSGGYSRSSGSSYTYISTGSNWGGGGGGFSSGGAGGSSGSW